MLPALLIPLAIAAAYLVGSIPFALVSSRLFGLADPRSYGSKNPGATNVLRSGNKAAAAFTLFGDAAKGWLAVFLAASYVAGNGGPQGLIPAVALAVFFGHLFPVFLGFKGGKGVATAAGVLLALDPLLGFATLGTWLFIALTLRYSSLAALVAAATAPLYAGMFWGFDAKVIGVAVMSMALIARHWQNLQRLLTGTEPKLGKKKAESGEVSSPGKRAARRKH